MEFSKNCRVVIVSHWSDTPETEEVSGDCMQSLGPGIFYHYRLNTIFVVSQYFNK